MAEIIECKSVKGCPHALRHESPRNKPPPKKKEVGACKWTLPPPGQFT